MSVNSRKNSNNMSVKCLFMVLMVFINVLIVNATTLGNNKLEKTSVTSKVEKEIPLNVQEVISQQQHQIDHYNTWDKAKASETVLNELKSFKKWVEIKSDFETTPPIHKIFGFQKHKINGSYYMIVLAYTGSDLLESIPSSDQVCLSLFEFKYDNGWVLVKKNIGFGYYSQNYNGKVNYSFKMISKDNFGLFIKNGSTVILMGKEIIHHEKIGLHF